MDLELKINLPSDQLSTTTLRSILRDATRAFERAIEDSIASSFRHASRTKVRRVVRGRVTYYLQDFRRGSWEIALASAIGALLAKAAYDLGIDLVKSSPTFERLKERVRGELSTSTAEHVDQKFRDLPRLGSHKIERVTIEELRRPDGVEGRRIEIWLADREGALGYQDSATQIDTFFRDMEGDDENDDNTDDE